MSFYPDLANLSLERLTLLFHGSTPEDEKELYLSEVAHQIAAVGKLGIEFLLAQLPDADGSRKLAALAALATYAPNHPELRTVFRSYLGDEQPMAVAEAVDGLALTCDRDSVDEVLALKNHSSPFVRGSVLRYLAKLFPERAKPVLFAALHDPHYIVRENAADELDELDDPEAIPHLRPLIRDPNPDVRQAARTAVANLKERASSA